MLVTEYMPRGDLWRALAKDHPAPGGAPASTTGRVFGWWRRGRGVALDVTRALAFMHSKRVLHCDIKSSNILLGRDGTAKLADVGLARFLTRDATVMSREGTFDWSSPELLAGKGVDEKTDVFSLGVVLWEIVSGDRPRLRQMRGLRVPEECPAEVAALIDACRSLDPAARPTAREAYDALAAAPWSSAGGGGGARPAAVGTGGSPTAAAGVAAGVGGAPAGAPPGNHLAAASPFAGPAEQAGGGGGARG
jgi:serine/threonine protein kinase